MKARSQEEFCPSHGYALRSVIPVFANLPPALAAGLSLGSSYVVTLKEQPVDEVLIPLSILSLMAIVVVACWLYVRLRRHLPDRSGLCRHCGYDLRASKDRCPECGHSIPPEIMNHRDHL